LARGNEQIPQTYVTFLSDAYDLKSVSDYGTGAEMDAIDADDAKATIETAGQFIQLVERLLS
jgi:hypothetical protein